MNRSAFLAGTAAAGAALAVRPTATLAGIPAPDVKAMMVAFAGSLVSHAAFLYPGEPLQGHIFENGLLYYFQNAEAFFTLNVTGENVRVGWRHQRKDWAGHEEVRETAIYFQPNKERDPVLYAHVLGGVLMQNYKLSMTLSGIE